MKAVSKRELAVVTGASSGIGYELARQFAKHDFDLIIAAEDRGITRTAHDIEAAYSVAVDSIRCDLSTYEGVEDLVHFIEATGRPVAAIAINAGIGLGGRFSETSLDKEIELINLNVVSTVHLAKRMVQRMLRRGQGGRMLFTSSIVADMPNPYQSVYAATKAFVQSFSEALRYELKDKGIKVTALQPGATETNFFHRAGLDDTKVGVSKKDDPADVAKEGFEALMDDKDHVVAGSLKNKVMSSELLPDGVKARMVGDMSKPGSASTKITKKSN
jgi:short-subunit dehydrogenase